MIAYRFQLMWCICLCLTVFLALRPVPSYAGVAKCYKIPQFEAEQGLRIHSELLVISLTCQKTPGNGELYSKYQRFTNKNKLLIADYENRLINFFRSQGSKSPSKELHTLRTSLANKISQHAINMSISSFCSYFSNRIDRALNMDKKTLQRWARQIWSDQKTSYNLCSSDKAMLTQETKISKERRQLLIKQQRRNF